MVLPPGAGAPPPPDDPTLTFQRAPRWPLPPPPATQFPPPSVQPRSDASRVAGGLALLAVPVVALVVAYVLPTIRTYELSRLQGFALGETEDAGGANYDSVLASGELWDGIGHLLGPTGLMVLGGAVVAPLIALLVHRAGAGVRAVARVAWALAAITFAPAALTVAWLVDRVVTESEVQASLYDWPCLVSGVVIGTGVLTGLAALRGGNADGRTAGTVAAAAGLTALALAAAGLQTFAFDTISGLPADVRLPLHQVYDGVRAGMDVGSAAATSVILLGILAVLGVGAAVLFAAAKVRIDVDPEPAEPAGTRAGAAVAAFAVLLLALAAVGYFLLPWLARAGEVSDPPQDLWFTIRRTWVPPLITTGVAVTAAAVGGFAIGALRPFGDASRWVLLLFAPWLFVGTGPLAAAHLEAVAEPGEWVVIGSLPPRAWIAVPLLFLFTALCWGLQDRRRARIAQGHPRGAANAAFAKAALPFALLAVLALLLVHVQDLFWNELTYQDMLSAGVMRYALEHLDFEHTGIAYGFPLPVLIPYALAAAALAVWYLPRVAVRTGRA
ncbi:hypothetical protein [Glycomyces terrestris]|uniref:Sugar ABC transporter permease n=1 Tax=Glycomyces terrestris TaxID=2493553 RepID=A0A426V100_9ACTN|nr:hypothetical protein [Glycomyces terrestris]RRS00516.1 hypothetical protein EIW28_08110 [Glycomyces terrestris]